MATTIDQIRKVNIYEEDEKGIRTLVQENVPLGSNVVMKKEAPEEELYLLTGKEDTIANTITLYPTKVKVTSGGSIDATDFTITGSSVNGKYVSTITWNEGEETLEDGNKLYARRLYYYINDNKVQVKNEAGDNSLNLLQVPYLELYTTNTIKTTKNMAKPLFLNVENVVEENLASNTKVVLGHTAIKNSTLDIVDNTNGYLGARLGIDTRDTKRYGYLNFYKTEIKEDNTIDRYETGSIFTDTDENFCIIPRNIHFSKIDEPDKDSKGNIIEKLPVISGYLGTENHQFKSLWAENLHGNINPVIYTSAAINEGDKYLKTYTNQFIYIDPSRGNSMKDLPEGSKEGFCFTLSASATNKKFKQIFLNTENDNDNNKYLYVRTGQENSGGYGNWHKIGTSEWIDCDIGRKSNYKGNNIDYDSGVPYFIFNKQYLDIYKNNRLDVKARGIRLKDIKDGIKQNKKHVYFLQVFGLDFLLVFSYRNINNTDTICLWSGITAHNIKSEKIQFKQYD